MSITGREDEARKSRERFPPEQQLRRGSLIAAKLSFLLYDQLLGGRCKFVGMVDTELIVQALRDRGHTVGNVISVPENAGEYEFIVDGKTLTLIETRALLEDKEPS